MGAVGAGGIVYTRNSIRGEEGVENLCRSDTVFELTRCAGVV